MEVKHDWMHKRLCYFTFNHSKKDFQERQMKRIFLRMIKSCGQQRPHPESLKELPPSATCPNQTNTGPAFNMAEAQGNTATG